MNQQPKLDLQGQAFGYDKMDERERIINSLPSNFTATERGGVWYVQRPGDQAEMKLSDYQDMMAAYDDKDENPAEVYKKGQR